MMITSNAPELKVSQMAESLIGSEIIKLAGEINELIAKGEKIFNFTIGDFDPKIFPIPEKFTEEIIKAYQEGYTNYPPANGIAELRKAISSFLQDYQGVQYKPEEILVTGGARPLIYAIYRTLLDKGDKVLFPVPSWNNNHYCHLVGAEQVMVETTAENNFMPLAEELEPHIKSASLVSLCSPLNPTGTIFSKESLEDICRLIIKENQRRNGNGKPLYLLYDQIYWMLTFGEAQHFDPVSLFPELRDYTIYVDGLSKSFAATGVRVGWSFGPLPIIDKMKTILGHVGAWAPKAEQVAAARFMNDRSAVDAFMLEFKEKINARLQGFYKGFRQLRSEGFNVDAVYPQAAIYLTVKIDVKGKKTADGTLLETTKDVTSYILKEAKLAMVPFYAFGADENSPWFRLSIGTCALNQIEESLSFLKQALSKLS